MLDARNDEMPMSEWLALPETSRLAIAREHGYRKRPTTASSSASPSPSPIVPKPAPANPAREAEGRRLEALILEWKRDPKLRARPFGDLLLDRGWTPDGGFSGAGPTPPDAQLPFDERVRAAWQASAEIRDEFGTLETYRGFCRAEERNLVHQHRGRVTSAKDE